jgi:hypothetical protein
MSNEFIIYLFNNLREHVEKLKEEAYAESPDGDRLEYHSEKITGIISMIETKGFQEVGAIRILGKQIG